MIPWSELIQSPWVHRLGWTLLHFLWQGAVVAGVWAGARWLLRRHAARVRYGVACGLFLLLAAAPVVTLAWLPAGSAGGAGEFQGTNGTHGTKATDVPGAAFTGWSRAAEGMAGVLNDQLPWLVVLWLGGVGMLSLRLVHGYWTVRGLARRDVTPIEEVWRERLERLQERLRLSRPVRVLVSAVVEIPTVIGWLRPLILVPASSLSGLTPAQLELILAHELAHIRRHDHWVNLLQVLVETVLFYHPAVWWLSAEIRLERELCCDDLAVTACGDRMAYARALTALETLRQTRSVLALGADGGSLLHRIRHVLGLRKSESAARARVTLANAMIGMGIVMVAAGLACLAVSPRDHVAGCKLLLRDAPDAHAGTAGGAAAGGHSLVDPYFLQTEFEKMLSMRVLLDVVQRLQLTEKWKGEGEPLSANAAAVRLRRQIQLRQVPRSAVVEVQARAERPEEAVALANALTESYRNLLQSARTERSRAGIDQLKTQLESQEQRVRELQAAVSTLRHELRRVSDSEPEAISAATLEPETVRRLEGERVTAEAQLAGMAELLARLKALRARSEAELVRALPGAYPDADLSKLLQDLWTTETQLVRLSTQQGKDHPEVQALSAMQRDLDQKVRERVEGILAGLEVRVAAKDAELVNLKESIQASKTLEAHLAERHRPYLAAKRTLEENEKIRDALLLRSLQETVDSSLPAHSVTIIEQAQASRMVARWGRLALNLCGFGLLTATAGVALRGLGRRASPVPQAA